MDLAAATPKPAAPDDDRARPSASRTRRRALAPLGAFAATVVLLSSCVLNGAWATTAPGVVPVQGLSTAFTDVSCVAQDWCMAVGAMGDLPMVQIWDGTSWSVVQAPPLGEDPDSAYLRSVDCGTPTSCLARIDRFPDYFTDTFEWVVAWDGQQWHDLPGVGQVDGPYPDPAPLSCAPDGTCVVVIQRMDVTVTWDGSTFTTTPDLPTGPWGDVAGIDCLAGDQCVATIWEELMTWDGEAWALIPDSEIPPGQWVSQNPGFPDVAFACTSIDDCVTFGLQGTGPTFVGLHWDGSAWITHPLPDPTRPLTDLSCAGPGECLGVATSFGGSGPPPTAVAWNGASWFVAPVAPSGIRRVSCLARWCLGVGGSGTPLTPVAATYTWTNP